MEVKYDQANFTLGEIDPKAQKRSDWDGYYRALKEGRNILVIPQGGFQSRWGTKVIAELTVVDPNTPLQAETSGLLYDDDAIYKLIWENLSLKIYLAGNLLATVVTPFASEDIANLRPTQLENRIIIAWGRGQPYQLIRSANAANVITGVDTVNNYLSITTPITNGFVYPAVFTTTGTLPATSPIIYTGVTYFVRAFGSNSVRVYATSLDAEDNINYFTVTTAGTGTNNLIIQNTWALTAITFKFVPAYDFTGGYSALTFTPSATSGTVTITASGPIFTAAMVGGLFSGGGGIVRLTTFTDSTHMIGYTVEDFSATTAIRGDLSFLGEPAWSDLRGWPALSSYYQNRLVFGRTKSLPNGRWLSVVNDVYNFDDSEKLDDDAISWYPAGTGSGFIQAITSARSLMIHTNTNTQSTAVLTEVPITPTNANFPEQSKFGCLGIQPIFLDNQIIFVDKANNVINMIWEITQSAFATKNISVPSSGLIRVPVDMAAYAEPISTDGFYALFVNSDGTIANFQSLIEENVAAWTLLNTKGQVINNTASVTGTDVAHKFVRVATSQSDCWFITQRSMPTQGTAVLITGVSVPPSGSAFIAVGHGIPTTGSTMVRFATTGNLPVTTPQLTATSYWFARGIDANIFAVYANAADAVADTNRLSITNAGNLTTVTPWPLANRVYLEELSFDVRTDCSTVINLSVASNVINGLDYLNGCVVKVIADGYLLEDKVVVDGSITMEIAASNIIVGLQYVASAIPLPVSIPGVAGILFSPTHVRALYIAYYQSIGVTISGTDIPIMPMQDFVVGEVPNPQTGTWLYTPMNGWNSSDETALEIRQENPLPMTITALSYVMET